MRLTRSRLLQFVLLQISDKKVLIFCMIISELFTSLPKRDSVFWHNIGIEIKLQSLFFVRVLVNGRIPYKQTFAESLSLSSLKFITTCIHKEITTLYLCLLCTYQNTTKQICNDLQKLKPNNIAYYNPKHVEKLSVCHGQLPFKIGQAFCLYSKLFRLVSKKW